jgi:DNA sulfur modification protein DndD
MLLKSMKMVNWCSFLGEHVIDFDPKGGNSVYALFGENGKGKSSIVEAVEWVLFGKVYDTIIVEDKIKRKLRPLIDFKFYMGEKSSFALPLLTDKAFRKRDYKTEIEINFIHNNEEWTLLRSAQPKSGISGIPMKINDMEVYIRLEKNGGEISSETESPEAGRNSRIQPKIEQIIPESVSRFFFIRGDSVQEFTGLIQGDEKSTALKEQVDTVVGIPAITRSQKEFGRMAAILEDKVRKVQRRNMRNEGDKTHYDRLEKRIFEIENGFTIDGNFQEGLNDLREKLDGCNRRKETLEERMEKDAELRELLAQTESEEENLINLEDEIPGLKKALKKSGEGIWKIIIQRKINERIDSLQAEVEREKEIEERLYDISQELPHLNQRLDSADGIVPCPTCQKNRDALSDSERKNLDEERNKLVKEKSRILDEKEEIEGSLNKQNKIKDWRTDIPPDSFTENYERFWAKKYSIEGKKIVLQRMRELLKNQNVKNMKETQEEHSALISEITDISHDVHAGEKEIKDLKYEQTTLSSAKHGDNTEDVSEEARLEKKQLLLKWITDVWEQSLDEYRENIRESIDRVCTERWLETVAEPEKYSHVKTNINWGLEVYGKDGNWAAIGNDGHRTLLALCFIESLRFCSEIEFPLIFDNPGATIDQKVAGSVLNYYMKNAPGQFIVLSHSSGMREDEMMKLYGEDIDKAWRVDWIKGEDRNSELRLIGG